LSRARLDRDLARGADPDADPVRAYRAGQLTTMGMRRRIAAGIERVLEEADSARAGMSSEAPIQNRLVRDARPALHMLIDTLVADGPREPRGAALTLLLLTDTAGPLYAAGDSRALTQAALSAITALQDGRRP
jgi:hypothetical protein